MTLTQAPLVEGEEKMYLIDQENRSIILEQKVSGESKEKFLYPVVATMTGAAYETKRGETYRA